MNRWEVGRSAISVGGRRLRIRADSGGFVPRCGVGGTNFRPKRDVPVGLAAQTPGPSATSPWVDPGACNDETHKPPTPALESARTDLSSPQGRLGNV